MSAAAPDLLDIMEGRARRDAGMAQADGNADVLWRAAVDHFLERLAATGDEFTVDQVRDLAGDPPPGVHPNAMGARVMAAIKRGLIVRAGWAPSTRPSCHAHSNPTYRGAP